METFNENISELNGNPRYSQLVKIVKENGHVSVNRLAELLGVSTQTVRRDIDKLTKESVLFRYHGGVGQVSSAINKELAKREVFQAEEKKIIAKKLVQRIPDRSTIFISGGTTVEYVAKALEERKELRVITTSIRVAYLLYKRRDFDVLMPGGSVRSQNGGVVGATTQKFLTGFRADYLIMSVGAIEEDGTMLDFDVEEVAINKTMMENSKQIFLAADKTKFEASASVTIGSITNVDVLFTEAQPPLKISTLLEQNNVEIVCGD